MVEHRVCQTHLLDVSCEAYELFKLGLWYSLLIHHRFLDKLGIAAAMNISVVMKQALVGGYCGLLDINLFPLPVRLWGVGGFLQYLIH